MKYLGYMRVSRTGIVVSISPCLLGLGLFYSLSIHMRQSLGAWPTSIGEAGFPPALVTHAAISIKYFGYLLGLSIFAVPASILVCLFVPRWRHLVVYFVLYALAFAVCIGLMQLAPEPYLYWWLD